MLLHAREAGEELLAAKAELPHGQFKEWVERECSPVGYDMAGKYMRVAKLVTRYGFPAEPGVSIRAFLDAHATPTPSKSKRL